MSQITQEALALRTKRGASLLIWLVFLFVLFVLVWMYLSKIDQLIRGEGRVIPSKKIQTIENLEGGIVAKILVDEGDEVQKNSVLMELDKTASKSKSVENRLKIEELSAKIERLEAEAKGEEFNVLVSNEALKEEKKLYLANAKLLKAEVTILKKRLFQKENELKEIKAKKANLKKSLVLIKKEVEMKKKLLAQLVGSRNELNLAEQKLSSIQGEFLAASLAIPRLASVIEEVKSEIKKVKKAFQQHALEQLTKAKAELAQLKESSVIKEDRVSRATIRSPLAGVVQRIFHTTIGGVVKAGEPILEIIPTNDQLIINTQIRPADIASIYLGQEAIVRFTAYDFTIYGALKGEVVHISADTIVDEMDKKSYYQVQVKTYKNYLGDDKTQHKIMTGMVATVDIVGEKQRILDYLLKPILRAKQSVLSSR